MKDWTRLREERREEKKNGKLHCVVVLVVKSRTLFVSAGVYRSTTRTAGSFIKEEEGESLGVSCGVNGRKGEYLLLLSTS